MDTPHNALVPAGLALTSLADVRTLGEVLAKSGYFQDARDVAQAAVKVLAGQEVGLPPIAAMTGIYIVKGRVTFSAATMAALIKRSGRYSYRVIEHSDKACEIAFTAAGQEIGRSRFTLDDAKRARLGGDAWNGYPRNMLFARAMSNGARWYTPDVFGGPVYTPEELREGGADEPVPARVETTPEAPPETPPAARSTSYETFGAITMLTRMSGGRFEAGRLAAYFGEGVTSKTKLEAKRGEDEDAYRAAYDKLHKDYNAWKAAQA